MDTLQRHPFVQDSSRRSDSFADLQSIVFKIDEAVIVDMTDHCLDAGLHLHAHNQERTIHLLAISPETKAIPIVVARTYRRSRKGFRKPRALP